jgi:ferredoxin-NADP reductase
MRPWIDSILNTMSMYRLLSVSLSILFGLSVFLSLFGQLPYQAVAMIASASVLVLAAYLANLALGRLFAVQTHDESSFISALILFFLFSPTVEPQALMSLGLVAIVAMASKFVLVAHGRHIFNPAAIATVIAGVTGVAHTAWWIATPIMLPATALLALLILYKTRRLVLGGLFLLIAASLIMTSLLIDGQSLLEAGRFLLSWPLLYFAGFMLSEPLTSPPRQWQQYAVGAVVAVIFALPFTIGTISSSPAWALVIGNVIAYLFARRRHLQLRFLSRKQLTSSTDEYTFEVDRPINFAAGQYMELTVPHKGKDGRGIRRVFSIIGASGDSTIRFGIKMYDRSSSFKRAIKALEKGAVINATGVNGDFLLPKDATTPLLFVAGGVGITPFVSHLLAIKQANETRDITLIYSVANQNDLLYTDVLKSSGVRVIIVAKNNQQPSTASWIYHTNDRLDANDIATYIPDLTKRHAYVSGPPAMVDAFKQILRICNVRTIKSDYFTGY